VRACYAALAMQDGVGRYVEELRQRQGLDVQSRVRLNAGEVVVRWINEATPPPGAGVARLESEDKGCYSMEGRGGSVTQIVTL
jgi:class 3 adenylate cyclase